MAQNFACRLGLPACGWQMNSNLFEKGFNVINNGSSQRSERSFDSRTSPAQDAPFQFAPLGLDGTSEDRSELWLCHRRSFLLAGLLGLGGCKAWGLGGSSQSLAPAAVDSDKTVYVTTMARAWGAAPAKIDGVGMVSELNGTGSAPPPSGFRDELTEDLRVRGVPEPNKLLSEKWTSLVLLQGLLPAGGRKGNAYDVFVGLEPGSDTTSLEGGFLMPARMAPVQAVQGGRALQGRVAGNATGPVIINELFDGQGRGRLVSGVVPGGGRMLIDRQIGFQTKEEYRSIRDAMAVTASINARFNYFDNYQRQPVASAKNDATIDLEVPEVYRSNINRYLHVVRQIAIGENPTEQVSRLELLEQQLQDPSTTEVASLRLEAIGDNGLAILERALRHSDPKVRFMAAMSLIYQGQEVACEELGRLAAQEWAFRWHALTALGAMPTTTAKQTLRKLLHAASVETRYAAVRCLIQRQEGDQEVTVESFGPGGEEKENFALQTVFSTAEPVVHVARYKRREVVVFNPDQRLLPGLVFVTPGWTVQSQPGGAVEISKFSPDGRDRMVRCSDTLTDVIRTLGKLNATYTLVVQVLKQAAAEESLEGRLVLNALPKPERAYDSQGATAGIPDMFQGDLHGETEAEPPVTSEISTLDPADGESISTGLPSNLEPRTESSDDEPLGIDAESGSR